MPHFKINRTLALSTNRFFFFKRNILLENKFYFSNKKIWGGGKLFFTPMGILFPARSFSLLMADGAEIRPDFIFRNGGKLIIQEFSLN